MQRPSYTVVALVVLVFACFALIKQTLMRFVPPAISNELVSSPETFLAEAGHQPIRWQTLSQNPFKEGALTGKPILLVVGVAGSKIARQLDGTVFGDGEIGRSVAQRFFCIRIDGYDHPEWLNAILPISRLRQKITTTFQVWLLGRTGHVLGCLNRDDIGRVSNLLRWFDSAEELFGRYGAVDSPENPFFDQQQLDVDFLASRKRSALPSFSADTKVLRDLCNVRYGGFPSQGIQVLSPNAWRFLSLTGDTDLLRASLDPLLLSPIVDLQDGGFFNLSESTDYKSIDLDKNTKRNAEMMLTLALEGQIEGDPFYKELAGRTYDWLMEQARQNGMLAACQLDDSDMKGRSPRLSFPDWRLREALDGSDATWARQNFDLEPVGSPQMLPRLESRSVLVSDRDRCFRILAKLRATTQDLPTYSDDGYLDVNGHALACMLEACRLLDAESRLRQLRPLLAKLDRFRSSSGLVHSPHTLTKSAAYLGDYLAFADVKLQEYLCLGRVEAFRDGLAVLQQAVKQFHGARPGEFDLTASPLKMGGVKKFCVPEIADNLGESCTAQITRLLLDYGRLTSDTAVGQALLAQAKQTVSLFSNLAGSAGTSTGGFFCAAADVADGKYAVAVGPQARGLANDLYRRVPVRFVAPALSGLRHDLAARGPGIYVVGDSVEGPFTVDDAAKRLLPTLVTRPASGH